MQATAAHSQSQSEHPGSEQGSGSIDRVRQAVILLVVLHIAVFLVTVPLEYRRILDEIIGGDTANRLAQTSISVSFYAGYMTGIAALSGVVFITLGLLILLRRSDAFAPLFVALVLVVQGAQINGLFYALERFGDAGMWIARSAEAASFWLLATFFFLFPTGRFTPHWTRWVTVAIAFIAMFSVVLGIGIPFAGTPTLTVFLLGGVFSIMVYAQIHRYRWVCTQKERQQVKWALVGMISAVSVFLVATLAEMLVSDSGPLASMFWFTIANAGLLLIPLSITVAILRHQLLDIDRLINRTLVYTSVTGILGTIYTSSLIVLQLGVDLVASGSALEVTISTVIAAVLFRPVRDSVQRVVDRRFYRTRYDEDELLTQLSRSIRDEVDLHRVQLFLADTIDTAVRPNKISIWMAGTGDGNRGSVKRGNDPKSRKHSPFRTEG